MNRTILFLILVVAVCIAGCSGGFPFKWKPTEQQRQAADLTVKDIAALGPYVTPAAEPIRAEAQQAAEITQTYLGLPKQRPQPVSPANEPILQQAAADANRSGPTAGQVGTAIVNEAAQITTTGFDLAGLLLTAAGSIAGVWGLGKVKGRVDGWKNQAGEAEIKAAETLQAFREVVSGIDRLDPATKDAVKRAQDQSRETRRLVADAKDK